MEFKEDVEYILNELLMLTSFPSCRILIAELSTESKNSTTSLFRNLKDPSGLRKGNITEIKFFFIDDTRNGSKPKYVSIYPVLYRQLFEVVSLNNRYLLSFELIVKIC